MVLHDYFLLRHGETDWNAAHRMQGQTPSIPLNINGKQQAEMAGRLLARYPIDLIVSSTLDRAVMTAEIIAAHLDAPVVYDARLMERRFGKAEGMTPDEIMTAPEIYLADIEETDASSIIKRQPIGAESWEELKDRASSAFLELLAKHTTQNLLFVTHGAWLRALVTNLTGAGFPFPNARPYKAFESGKGWEFTALT